MIAVLWLPRCPVITYGGRQIEFGGVRVPVGVNVPKRKDNLRRNRNQCDPGKLAMPPERHDGPPSKCYSITLCRSASSTHYDGHRDFAVQCCRLTVAGTH